MNEKEFKELEEKLYSLYQGEIIAETMLNEFCDEICFTITNQKYFENLGKECVKYHIETYRSDDNELIVRKIVLDEITIAELRFVLQEFDENEDEYKTYCCEEVRLLNEYKA